MASRPSYDRNFVACFGWIPVAFLTACTGTRSGVAPCSEATCPSGCCDTLEHCQLAQDSSACGRRGAACVTCGSAEMCVDGRCAPADAGTVRPDAGATTAVCRTDNCDGCCFHDLCVPWQQQYSSLCGVGGAFCADCGTQFCAHDGTCVAACPVDHTPTSEGFCAPNDVTDDGGHGGPHPCSPGHCAGCCENGACVVPSHMNDGQCGAGGQVCSPCNPTEHCTAAGLCVETPDAGAACATASPLTFSAGVANVVVAMGSATDEYGGLPSCPSAGTKDKFYSFVTDGGLDFEATISNAVSIDGGSLGTRALVLLSGCPTWAKVDCAVEYGPIASKYAAVGPWISASALPAGQYFLVVSGNGDSASNSYALVAHLANGVAPAAPTVDAGAASSNPDFSGSDCSTGPGTCSGAQTCISTSCAGQQVSTAFCFGAATQCLQNTEGPRPVCTCDEFSYANACLARAAGKLPHAFDVTHTKGNPASCASFPGFSWCPAEGFCRNDSEMCVMGFANSAPNWSCQAVTSACLKSFELSSCMRRWFAGTCGANAAFGSAAWHQNGIRVLCHAN